MSFFQELMKHLTALPVTDVKKLVSKYNKELDIKPVSKLKKAEILQKIKDKKPMDKQLVIKLTNEARATHEGKKAQKASEKQAEKKPVEKFGTEKKKIKVKKAKPDFLDIDKDGDKKEPMKKAAKEAKKKEKKTDTKPTAKVQPKPKLAENMDANLKKIDGKRNNGILTTRFSDKYGGFESKKKNLVMSGVFGDFGKNFDDRGKEFDDKYVKLDFFLANHLKDQPKLEKGEARKTLCKYLEYLKNKGVIDDTYEFRLYADPSYGANLRDDIGTTKRTLEGLVKMYEGMTFKKFGDVGFGNQPMKTTIGEFLNWCKSVKK